MMRLSSGRKYSTVVPDVPEIPVETAIVGEVLPVMRWLGKIQVLLRWIEHEQWMILVDAVITIELSLSVCTV